jgi:hypothetical protein
MKTEQVGFRIDKKLKDRLVGLTKARLDGVVTSVSQVLNAALEAGIADLEQQLIGKPGVRKQYRDPGVKKSKSRKA